MSGEVEAAKDLGEKPADVRKRWLKEIELSSTHEETWRERADKIIALYRDEKERAASSTRFNILFANTEVLKGALYSRPPVPDCRRRFLDKDPAGRTAATVLQRGLAYSNDCDELDDTLKRTVEDMVLPGRGQARVRYAPTFAADGKELLYEEVQCDYVEWDMFRCSPAKRWKKVRWVAFGELMTRDDVKAQFPDIAEKVMLDWMPKGKADTEENQLFKRVLVWSIWNKADRKVYVVSSGYKEGVMKETPDPLKLERFFPCPEPLYDIKTTGSLVPIPEYTIYQDQAIQLEELATRIAVLTDALRRRGVYDKSIPELANLAKAGDNEFIGVDEYTKLVEKGGLEAAFQELPIDGLAKVLTELIQQAADKKAEIYELIGLSDIMRGTTKATETLGAQELKSQYGEIRIGPRQTDIARFARDIMRLKAEIIAEHFQPETLSLMTGLDLFMTVNDKQAAQALAAPVAPMPGAPPAPPPVVDTEKLARPTWEEVMTILRSDKLRGFRVDIETDSTIKPRADDEQKNRIDLLTACSGFLEKAGPAVQAGMMPIKVATELLMFGVRAFKTGPQLEETLDEWAEEAQKPKQGADPAAMAQQQAQMQEQMQMREDAVKKGEQEVTGRHEQAQKLEQTAKERHTQADVREAKLADAEKRFSMMQQLNDFMDEQRAAMNSLVEASAKKELDQRSEELAEGESKVTASDDEAQSISQTLADSVTEIAAAQKATQESLAQLMELLIKSAAADKTVTVTRQRDGSLKGAVTLQ